MALAIVKRAMYLEEIDTVDARDLMNADSSKWQRVSVEVMKCGLSPCPREPAACKTKWNQVVPDYKKIADFFARTGRNGAEYWDLTSAEKKREGLPKSFPQDLFFSIHEWFGKRPTMLPPHTRDLLSQDDGNYRSQPLPKDADDEVQVSEQEGEDPMDIATPVEASLPSRSTTPMEQQVETSDTASVPSKPIKLGARTGRQRPPLPAGVTPHVISSTDTSEVNPRRQLGNTAVKRKSLSGHTLIAEATRATGDVMAGQMKEMVEASRDLERSKIDVQLKLFSENMQYQREKDLRLHESSVLANQNAKLAIMKQGEVVQCLAQLTSVLSMGLRPPSGRSTGSEPQAAPPFVTVNQTVPSDGPPVLHTEPQQEHAATTDGISTTTGTVEH